MKDLWIDTHTHLFVDEFADDREQAFSRAESEGITRFFLPNIDDTTVCALLDTCLNHPGRYPLIGLHPTSVDGDWQQRLRIVQDWLDKMPDAFYGIGEVGMDLYWDRTWRKEQMEVFDRQVQWAVERGFPLVIHCREAYPELLEVLQPYRCTSLHGIFHSFTGNAEEAERLLEYDRFMLGVNGVVTFKKSVLPDTLQHVVPLERIVLETDAPYLAPVPYRGRRNESAYLIKTAEKVAEVYGCSLQKVAEMTTANALKAFGNVLNR